MYQNKPIDTFYKEYKDYLVTEVCQILTEDTEIEAQTKKLFPEIEPTISKIKDPINTKHANRQQKINCVARYNSSTKRKFYLHMRQKEENSPLVFSCFLSMLWSETYREYEADMMAKYEDIQGKFDGGVITMEEYDEEIAANLPNPAEEVYSSKLSGVNNLYFSFSNSPYARLMKSERVFSARAAVFNANGELLDIVTQHK